MAKPKLPCPTLVRLLLSYDPGDGTFRWRHRKPWMMAQPYQTDGWNRRHAGRLAMCTNVANRMSCNIGGRSVPAGRAAWVICHGEWPKNEIDHIDQDPTNNRFSNLRNATRAQNAMNRRGWGGSRYRGVCFSKRDKRWIASISANGKQKHLGSFMSETEAAAAYREAAIRLHGEFASLY